MGALFRFFAGRRLARLLPGGWITMMLFGWLRRRRAARRVGPPR
jgi:hypothetical protein